MKMKALLMLAICAFLLSVTAQMARAADPTDVPPDHWAYQAVKMLIDKGYLQLYQDQTFQGNKPVDRYTLASVVGKILTEIASGGVGTSREDVKTLSKLTNELREELVKLIGDTSTYGKKTAEMSRYDVVLKEDLIKTQVSVQNLSGDQEELRSEVQQMLADLIAVKKQVSQLENDVAQLQKDKEQLQIETSQLRSTDEQLKNETARLKEENHKQKIFLIIAMLLGLAGAAK